MKLEDQVCSLELAKKLKELWVKQESQFYYCNVKSIGDHILNKELWMIAHLSQVTGLSDDWFSAFTVSELGVLMPDLFGTFKDKGMWKGAWEDNQWSLVSKLYASSKTEADARAKIIIYLIENGLISKDGKVWSSQTESKE